MRRHAARGVSLVEVLAGLAIGLFVIAAALAFVLGHLRDDRAAAERTRLVRELRMAADLVAHDLRRAGHWSGSAPVAWDALPGGAPAANPYAALAPDAAASDAAQFSYAPPPPAGAAAGDEQLGFRLRRGVLEALLGDGQWQALTDAGSVVVTHFSVTPSVAPLDLQPLCHRPCVPGASSCPPAQAVRQLAVEIGGRSPRDARAAATAHGLVRVRNDIVRGACPA